MGFAKVVKLILASVTTIHCTTHLSCYSLENDFMPDDFVKVIDPATQGEVVFRKTIRTEIRDGSGLTN